MRVDVPAWPPVASRSTSSVRSPSEAPYTAAARPVGPPPDDHEVVGVALRARPAGRPPRRARDCVGLVRMRPSGSSTTEQSAAAAIAACEVGPGRDPRRRPGSAHSKRTWLRERKSRRSWHVRVVRAADHDRAGAARSAAWVSRPSTRSWMPRDQPLLERAPSRARAGRTAARSKRATRIGVAARAPAKNGAPNTIGSSPSQSPGSLAHGDAALAVGIALHEVVRPRTAARRTRPTRPRARATARRRCARRRPARPRG